MASHLNGAIPKLTRGEKLDDAAIEEISRILDILRDNGWSGYIPADDALRGIIKPNMGDLIEILIPLAQKIDLIVDAEIKDKLAE